jgi:DNA-3-methyladenine glycosylase II
MTAATTIHTLTGALTARPPFDFAKTLAFLGAFSPTAGEQAVEPASITKAVTSNGRAVAFTLRRAGTEEAPQLAYTLASEQPLTDAERAAVEDRISFFLSLDDDLAPFYAIGRADPSFVPVIERLYGLHQPKFLSPFEIACWAILGQRVPMPIAHRVKLALVERWGTSITLPTGTYRAFPNVAQLAAVDPADLASVVRNERKVEYLRAVVEFFSTVDEQWLRTGDAGEVAAAIRGVKGIGEWSSHFILVRGLGRMERLSVVDRELAKAAAKLYNGGQPLEQAEMQRIFDRYGATQGYWAYYARIATIERMRMIGME